MNRLVIGLATCMLAGDAMAAPLGCWPGATGSSDHVYTYVDSNGTTLTYDYKVYVPTGYSCSGDASPLVAMFHGGNQSVDDFVTTPFVLGFLAQAESEDAVLVALEANASLSWNHDVGPAVPSDEHVDVVRGLLGQIAGTNVTTGDMNIDRDQVHGIGFSDGGIFLQYLSIQMPNLFGAIAAIAAPSGAYDTTCEPFTTGCTPTAYENVWDQTTATTTATDVDVMLVRGVDDDVFPEAGGWIYEDPTTESWVLSSFHPSDPSEYGLWKDSIGCTTETVLLGLDYKRYNCTGATDLRVDVVFDMGHWMPVDLPPADYPGPQKVSTFLFNHPK